MPDNRDQLLDRLDEKAHGLALRGVSKRYPRAGSEQPDTNGHDRLVLNCIDLSVQAGELVVIIGPSGCGKSTLLGCIAGLERYDGSISLHGSPVVSPRPEIAMVFQKPHLLPWRTVLANTEYGMEMRGVPKKERRDRAREVLKLVGLAAYSDHFPGQISGGMQQRVNLARALAVRPELLLMDEPFGALDAITREFLQEELLNIVAGQNVSVVFVTHDISEAIFLGDRVVLLGADPGRILVERAVHESKPRSLAYKRSPDFQDLLDDLWKELVSASKAQLEVDAQPTTSPQHVTDTGLATSGGSPI